MLCFLDNILMNGCFSFKICFLLQLQLAIMQSKTSINPFNQVNIESTLLSFFMTYLLTYMFMSQKLTLTCSIFLTCQIWDTIRDVIFLQGKKYYLAFSVARRGEFSRFVGFLAQKGGQIFEDGELWD